MRLHLYDNSDNESKGKITVIDLYQLMLVYLKLTNQISWHWIWVLSPYWVLLLLLIIAAIIVKLVE